jgi:precorrin-2/cobalt-factor-2 C20-methyltransferase
VASSPSFPSASRCVAKPDADPDRFAARGRLFGVGVGPGDPGLVTIRALEVLRAVPRVVAPSTDEAEPGRAELVVRAHLPDLPIERVAFPTARPAAEPHGPDAAAPAFARAAERIVGWLVAGQDVAFVTLGDPTLYSTFTRLATAVRDRLGEVRLTVISGISAFQAVAAATCTVLAEGAEALTIVTAHDGVASLEQALASGSDAVVVYKAGRRLEEVAELLERHGRLDDAVVGELVGLPGERVEPLAAARRQGASYLATVLVPPRRSPPARNARARTRCATAATPHANPPSGYA